MNGVLGHFYALSRLNWAEFVTWIDTSHFQPEPHLKSSASVFLFAFNMLYYNILWQIYCHYAQNSLALAQNTKFNVGFVPSYERNISKYYNYLFLLYH